MYEKLLADDTIENPTGDILLFKPVFVAPEHVFAHCRSWLAYAGDTIWSCGDTKRSGSHRIRTVHEVTVLEGLGPSAHLENTLSGHPPLTSSGHKSYPFRLGRRFVYCLSPDQGESSVQPLDRVLGRPSWLTIQVEGGKINFSPSPLPYGVLRGACLTSQQPR